MLANLSKCFHNRSGSKFVSAGIMAGSVLLWGMHFDQENSSIVHSRACVGDTSRDFFDACLTAIRCRSVMDRRPCKHKE
jgi:hypothetical protein